MPEITQSQLDKWDAHRDELYNALEDCAGNLEDAADTIEKVAQAVYPGGTITDALEYRRVAKTARAMLP